MPCYPRTVYTQKVSGMHLMYEQKAGPIRGTQRARKDLKLFKTNRLIPHQEESRPRLCPRRGPLSYREEDGGKVTGAATWEKPERFLLVHDPGKALDRNVQGRGEKALFGTSCAPRVWLCSPAHSWGQGAGMGVGSKNVLL